MFVGTTRELAAAVIASTIVISGTWVYAATAQAGPDPHCARVADLAERMAEKNGEFVGTMGARSVALRLGMDEKVATLTPKMEGLRAEYESLHLDMREAATACR